MTQDVGPFVVKHEIVVSLYRGEVREQACVRVLIKVIVHDTEKTVKEVVQLWWVYSFDLPGSNVKSSRFFQETGPMLQGLKCSQHT